VAALRGSSVERGVQYSLTPGGTAPVNPRWLILNTSGSVTPVLIRISNLATGAVFETLGSDIGLPAGAALLIDPEVGVWSGSMAGIAGYWPLADADGTARDVGLNARDLSENGTVTYLADGPDGYRPERRASVDVAIANAGNTGNYLSSTATDYNFAGDFSLCCWFRIDDAGSPTARWVMLSKAGQSSGTAQGYTLLVDTTGLLTFVARLSSNTRTAAGVTALQAGRWYFAAVSVDSNQVRLYLGAEQQPPRLEATATGGTLTSSSNPLRIGTGHYTDNTAYAGTAGAGGRVAQPALYSVALTAAQIEAVWRRGPQAINDAAVAWQGQYPELDPRAGSSNLIEVLLAHGSTNPQVRIATVWRSRWL